MRGGGMASKAQSRRKDGTIAWRVLYRHNGRQRSATFDTQQARDKWLRLIKEIGIDAALESLSLMENTTGRAVTLADYARENIEARTGIGEGTRHRYLAEIDRDWTTIGALPIEAVTEKRVAQWIRSLEKAGASAKTIRNKHGLLSSVLESAVRDRSIDLHENPCKITHLRKDDVKTEMVFLTHEEFATLLDYIPAHYKPFVTALAGMGLRFGEATALQVGDYDPNARTIRVVRAWKKADRGWVVGPPKTRRGRRTIGVPEQLVGYMDTRAESEEATALMFTTSRGGRIKHSTFYEDTWTRAVTLANGGKPGGAWNPSPASMWASIEPAKTKADRLGKVPRIHDLRHTAASWAIAAGASLQDVQYFLGHESIQTTSDRYAHLMPGRMEAVARVMSVALSPALPTVENRLEIEGA